MPFHTGIFCLVINVNSKPACEKVTHVLLSTCGPLDQNSLCIFKYNFSALAERRYNDIGKRALNLLIM